MYFEIKTYFVDLREPALAKQHEQEVPLIKHRMIVVPKIKSSNWNIYQYIGANLSQFDVIFDAIFLSKKNLSNWNIIQ